MASNRRVLTPEFRMVYPKLDVAVAFRETRNGPPKGDPVYSTECILAPALLEKFLEDQGGDKPLVEVDIRRILVDVAKAEWPDMNVKAAVESGELFWPLIDGDVHAEKLLKKAAEAKVERNVDHYKGQKVFRISASQQFPPVLTYVDNKLVKTINRGSDADMAKAKNLFVSGYYGFAEVSVAATKTAQGKFLKFYVNSVRMLRAGDRIGGGSALMSRFDGVKGGKGGPNPMEGLDDEIPF